MGNTAAFFRLEGVLTRRSALSIAAFYAANGHGVRDTLGRLGRLALAAPVHAMLSQNDRTTSTRLVYVAMRDISEDRIEELSDEYFTKVLSKSILRSGEELLKRARRDGHRIVVLAESLEPVLRRLHEELPGIDELVCNRLEYRENHATGRLLDPVIGGHDAGRWIRDYAQKHNIDLSRSVAYASHGPDLLMLSAVGHPCAVNPDYTLRRAAEGADWPVTVYDA